jgi:hypothetical protein
MRELLEELAAAAPTKPNVALAFVAPAGLKEVQAALGSEVSCGCSCVQPTPLLGGGGLYAYPVLPE